MRSLRHRRLFAVLILVWCLSGGILEAEQASPSLVLFFSNDTHARLFPDQHETFGADWGGMARRSALIEPLRQAGQPLLVVDGGDIFQGTPVFSLFKGEKCIRAFSLAGYDATVIGNHEMDCGLPHLVKMYASASYALLCANVVDLKSRKLLFPPAKIFRRGPMTVGVIGITGTDAWDSTSVFLRRGYLLLDPVETLRRQIAELRSQVDFLVVLSHSGYEFDVGYARNAPGIDLIVGGHTHTFIDEPPFVPWGPASESASPRPTGFFGEKTLIVQTGEHGSHLGRLDLWQDPSAEPRFVHRLLPVNAAVQVDRSASLSRFLVDLKAQLRTQTDEIIGTLAMELPYPDEEKKIRTFAYGSIVAESFRQAAKTDICLMNSGGIREPLPMGTITVGHAFRALPYDNTLVVFRLTGKDLHTSLSLLGRRFRELKGYQAAGVHCRFDAEGRLLDATVGAQPLDPAKTYSVCTSSFVAEGNLGGKDLFGAAESSFDTGIFHRDALIAYIRAQGTIKTAPSAPFTWDNQTDAPLSAAAQ